MEFLSLISKNLLNLPILCFAIGFFSPFSIQERWRTLLTFYILFCIGLKGGAPLIGQLTSPSFFFLLIPLIFWGLLYPFFSFYLLKKFTRIDAPTAAAVAASFGSVSVMTLITGISFLEHLDVNYQKFVIGLLAVMEIPAIVSGIFLAKKESVKKESAILILKESLLSRPILTILAGLAIGTFLESAQLNAATDSALFFFKPLLCLFLFDMGFKVKLQREHFRVFSWPLILFGFYTPLIGAAFGLLTAFFFQLDVGTGALVAMLTASASYIAVPAAMKTALPEAKEAVYLPLSLGIAFPFNVIFGVPAYYYLAAHWVS